MSVNAALEGLVVVDFGVGMAAALVSQFLATAGATVVRVNPRGGDPFENVYPAYALWRRHAVVEAEPSDARIEQLLAGADICLLGGEDFPGLEAVRDAARIAAAHPRCVILRLTGYPDATGNDGHRAVDLLVQARSGLVFEHFSDRPVYMAFEPGTYGAALHGLIGLLAAVYERERSGLGQVVTTSLCEGMLTYAAYFWMQLDRPTMAATFTIPKDPIPLVLRCSDDRYIHIVLGAAGSKFNLYRVLGMDTSGVDPADSGLPRPGVEASKFFGEVDLIAQYVARVTRDELLAGLWAASVPAEAVLDPRECWDEEQVRVSGLIETDAQGRRFLGAPATMRFSTAPRERLRGIGAAPLDGVKIVDLGAFVAGPYAATVLADLGADVIKVEAPGGDPNRASFASYTTVNRGKRSIVVDMKSPAGRAEVARLCAEADVVMNNFRTGVSARLGVDADSLHRAHPHLVVVENSAFGPTGPKAASGGFDPIIQAYCGIELRAGGAGNPPLWSRALPVDYSAGLIAAAALLLGLVRRARRGDGAAINVPLVNAGLFLGSDVFRDADGNWHANAPVNRAQSGRHPAESIHATRDGWVAIAARDDASAARLAQALDIALPASRAQWGEPEHDAIAAALAARGTHELMQVLRAHDIWAERCQREGPLGLLNSAAMIARGTVWLHQHPQFGRMHQIGRLVSFSRSRPPAPRQAPELDQHGAAIRREYGL